MLSKFKNIKSQSQRCIIIMIMEQYERMKNNTNLYYSSSKQVFSIYFNIKIYILHTHENAVQQE